jgi:hypothetical protein
MTAKKDVHGYEYDWLAVDGEGLVGFFSTAGGGYAPEAYLQDIDAFDAAIDAILRLPATTEATCSREMPMGLVNTWRIMAERGLYSFDSDPLGGPYRLVAAPLKPMLLESLPAIVGVAVRRVTLQNVAFRTVKEIAGAQIGG